jgi:putative membrane protein
VFPRKKSDESLGTGAPGQVLSAKCVPLSTTPEPSHSWPRCGYNPSMDKPAEQDPRVYFAAERTFLAWIRTGLGLMGVGFAVSRFGLFLREVSASASHLPAKTTGLSLWSGVFLVALGVIVTLSAVVRHVQLVRELRSGEWRAGRVSTDAVILGLVLAALGIAMALYLTLVR